MKLRYLSWILSIIALPMLSQAQLHWDEAQKVTTNDRSTLSHFGNALDVSGDYAIIGENEAEPTGPQYDYGAAYIYKRQSNGTWSQLKRLVADDRGGHDYFGNDVGIDNNWIAVGCLQDDEDENETADSTNAGSVYLYNLNASNQWISAQKIVPSDRTSEAHFGHALHISGRYLIVGAPDDGMDSLGGSEYKEEAGSAYIFYLNDSGEWEEVQKLVALDRNPTDNFGWSVHISDGIAIIGAPGNGTTASGDPTYKSGSFYIFKRQANGVWKQSQELYAPNQEASGKFGYSIDRSNDFIVVGAIEYATDASNQNSVFKAGACFIYQQDQNEDWSFSQKIVSTERHDRAYFGISVAIEDSIVLVGAPYWGEYFNDDSSWNNAGAAYLYKYDGTWKHYQTLRAYDVDEYEEFGTSIVIHNKELLIGAPGDHITGPDYKFSHAGAFYSFRLCETTPITISRINQKDLQANKIGTYQWLDCNDGLLKVENAVFSTFRPSTAGSYAVRVFHGGCVDTSECYNFGLGLETLNPNQIKLYPNPSNGSFTLESTTHIEQVIIFDPMGRIVQEFGSEGTYNLTNAPTGLYFVEVHTDTGVAVLRLELE